MLKIYNVLEKKNIIFFSNIKNINMYICGITVYDYIHIGHARIYIFLNVLIKYLFILGYKILIIRNITDIDDKIIRKKFFLNKSSFYISEINIMNMFFLMNKLNIINPSYEPRVTYFVKKIINVINFLLKNNYAYINKNGDVYYNIKNKYNYYILSRYNKFNLYFENNMINFIVWKIISKFSWNFIYGMGRPGWNIECVIMFDYYFNHINIHCGGKDLIFPHNENEFLLYKTFYTTIYNTLWISVDYLSFTNKKMSKSLGNYLYVQDIIFYGLDKLIFFLLLTHYRKIVNFTIYKFKISFNLSNIINNFLNKNKILLFKTNIFVIYFFKYLNNDLNIFNIFILFLLFIKKNKKYNLIYKKKINYILQMCFNIFNDIYNNKNKKYNLLYNLVKKNYFFKIKQKWKYVDFIKNLLF